MQPTQPGSNYATSITPSVPGQSHSTSGARPTMSRVPDVITTKDAAYLKDQLSWLLLAAKKCAHFAGECQEPAIQDVIKRIGQMHERQYQTLLKYLQTDNASVMQGVPQPQNQSQGQNQSQSQSQNPQPLQ